MKKKYLYTAIMLFAILVAGMGLTGWYVSQTQEQTDGQELGVCSSPCASAGYRRKCCSP